MTDRTCPGHCCHTIHQPFNHEQLASLADILIDGHQIARMLQPTGETTGRTHHYTCTNWDPTTQLCTDYANRPAICRDYPYGQTCEHCGLTDGIPPAERLAIHRATQGATP